MDYEKFIRFKPGSSIGDISPLLADEKVFSKAVDDLIKPFKNKKIDKIVGVEARGFIFAGAIAYRLKKGLVLIRKGKKLPLEVSFRTFVDYSGKTKRLEIHQDAIKPGEKCLIVDDWLETGSQAKAAIELVEELQGKVIGLTFLVNTPNEKAKKLLSEYDYHYLIEV